jgi:DNA-directed RNA polymerase specialized sigma24 family protein
MISQGVRTRVEMVNDSGRVEQLPLKALACRCSEETNRFIKGGASDNRYCLELFRRAVCGPGRELAWASLYQQYAPLVLAWVKQQPSAAPLLVQEGGAPLVNAAFTKLWHALTPDKIASFSTLEAVLFYFRRCAKSVVSDELRARGARAWEDALECLERELPTVDPADDVVATLAAEALWRAIEEELKGEEERVLLTLVYIHGLKPSEVCCENRRLFPTVDDVYRIKRNVLERLRRNRRLQQYRALQ